MAITNIITGELRNKVGSMVGAKWKGIAYVRAYTKPRDANTAAQQEIRSQFRKVTHFGSGINEGILKPFQAKPVKNQSPYNRFVQINQEMIADNTKGYESIRIFNGSLPVASGLSANASAAAGTVEVKFTPLQHGICKAEDMLIAVVYNDKENSYGYNTVKRGTGSAQLTLSVPAYFAEGDTLYVYLTASRKGTANGGTLGVTITAGA